MAATPEYKVYNAQKEYVAACKYALDAAILVSNYNDGATIRHGHSLKGIVWTEGAEDQPAGESYDHVADVIHARITEWRAR